MEGLRRDLVCETDQSTEVDRVVALVMKAIEGDVRRMAEAAVLKRDDELLGAGELEFREKVLSMGCHILEATIDDRKKGGTKAAAWSVPTAVKTHASSDGGPERS